MKSKTWMMRIASIWWRRSKVMIIMKGARRNELAGSKRADAVRRRMWSRVQSRRRVLFAWEPKGWLIKFLSWEELFEPHESHLITSSTNNSPERGKLCAPRPECVLALPCDKSFVLREIYNRVPRHIFGFERRNCVSRANFYLGSFSYLFKAPKQREGVGGWRVPPPRALLPN